MCSEEEGRNAATQVHHSDDAGEGGSHKARVDELLTEGAEVVGKVELYEQEHGFLPSAVTAMSIVPEGWELMIMEDRSYTLAYELGAGDMLEYRHHTEGDDSAHGNWYHLQDGRETLVEGDPPEHREAAE